MADLVQLMRSMRDALCALIFGGCVLSLVIILGMSIHAKIKKGIR